MPDQAIPEAEAGDTEDPHVPADLLELYEVLEYTGEITPVLGYDGEAPT